MYRDGLITQLNGRDEFELVGVMESEAAARARLPDASPDIVLCDMSLPGGLQAAERIRAAQPAAQVIVFAVSENEVDIPACAEAGLAGFVTRDASIEDLIAVVRGVARGEIVCSPKAAAALYRRVASLSAAREPTAPLSTLTSREREIASLIDRGLSNKDIARRLGIGLATAKNHVHHILEKVGVERRSEIAARMNPRSLPVQTHT
jgi:DNA-binding NarL/FixJ family response regulator